jgi:hypothetical protein
MKEGATMENDAMDLDAPSQDDEPCADTGRAIGDSADDAPPPVPGGTPCSVHGRRKPWVVCEHIERTLRESGEAIDYRLYKIVWLHDGSTGMTSEYRLCYPCAEAVGLTAEHVDAERANELLEDRLACVCSACGIGLLAAPSKRPHLIEARL